LGSGGSQDGTAQKIGFHEIIMAMNDILFSTLARDHRRGYDEAP
jgi:hypothetical protein